MKPKEFAFPLAVIFGIAILVMLFNFRSPHAFTNEILDVDSGKWIATNDYLIKESIIRHHELPLWTDARLTEPVLLAEPQAGVFSITTLLALITPDVLAAMKLSYLIYYVLAGLGMYLFLRKLKLGNAALIGAGAFMLNASVPTVFLSYTFFGAVYAGIPWVLLFIHIALTERAAIAGAVGAAVVMAIGFHAGGVEQLLFTLPLFGAYFIYLSAGKLTKRDIQPLIFAALTGILLFGLMAIKLLPALNLLSTSNREQAFDYATFLGTHVTSQNFIPMLIKSPTPLPFNFDFSAAIGLIALVLVAASLLRIRKRTTIAFWGILVLGLLLATENPLSYLVWKFVPLLGQTRNLYKALFIYNTAAAILAAIGYLAIRDKLSTRWPVIISRERIIAVALILAIIIELGTLNYWALTLTGSGFHEKENDYFTSINFDMPAALAGASSLSHIASKEGIFRIKESTTNQPFGVSTSMYNVRAGLSDIYGINNLWNPTYYTMPALAEQTGSAARIYGMLNVRYITSPDGSAPPGFIVEATTQPVPPTDALARNHPEPYYPFVFENTQFLPRAYGVSNAILVLGDSSSSSLSAQEQLMYSLIISPAYNPATTVIIPASNLREVTDLSPYDYVLVGPGAISENDFPTLQAYKNNGGHLLPDITQGENQFSAESIDAMFADINNSARSFPIEYLSRSPNHNTLRVEGTPKFIVLSEVYALYGGWIAQKDGITLPVIRANGALSAVRASGDGTYRLNYHPPGLFAGIILSVLAVASCAGLLIFARRRK